MICAAFMILQSMSNIQYEGGPVSSDKDEDMSTDYDSSPFSSPVASPTVPILKNASPQKSPSPCTPVSFAEMPDMHPDMYRLKNGLT